MPAVGRPKIDPDAPAAPTTPDEAIEQGKFTVDDIPADNPEDATVAQKIDQAILLLEERKTLNEKVSKVRELLTLLTETGSGSREQVAWVRFFLPRKTRKTGNGGEEVVEDSGEAGDE